MKHDQIHRNKTKITKRYDRLCTTTYIGDNRHSYFMSHSVALKKSSFYRLCLMSFWHPVKGSLGTKKAAFGQTIRFYCLGIKQKRKVVGRGKLGILDGHFRKFQKCRKIQKKVLLAQKAAPKKLKK